MSAETQDLRRVRGLLDVLGGLLPAAKNLLPYAPFLGAGKELLGVAFDFAMIEEPWGSTAGLKARLLLLVKAGEIITAQTASTDDDALVAQLRTLAENDGLVEFLAGLIARFQTENPQGTPEGLLAFVQSDAIQESLSEAVAEKQLDWAVIMEAIQLIIKIIGMFKASGGTTSTAADKGGFNF